MGTLLLLLTSLAARLSGVYLGKRTAALVELLQEIVGTSALALKRMGHPITEADLARWETNADKRDQVLAE